MSSNKQIALVVLILAVLWGALQIYGADKWKTARIETCRCQIDIPLFWWNFSWEARRCIGCNDAVAWYTSAPLEPTNQVQIFFHPVDSPSSEGLEEWMTEVLREMRARSIYDLGEQPVGKANIMARHKIYQIFSHDERIYYFIADHGYYAIEFTSKDFSKYESLFSHIL
ncbi:hypothetical protein D6779_07760, partial [Candidatus Parcubacteria bacterium]